MFAQALGLSVISSQPQVEVTGGTSEARQTVANTAGQVATWWAHVRHLLLRASVVLILVLFAASSALSVRAYVLYQGADSTTTDVIAASNSLLIELLNAETGQRGYLVSIHPDDWV